MFVYFEEGNPSAAFAPDVMVVFGVPNEQRRVYKLWEEGAVPAVVFEVSSRKTRRKDLGSKRRLCERLGIEEYFLWDPRYEYLTPPLQGFRLTAGAYREILPDADGCLASEQLGLRLCGDRNRLEAYDGATGARLDRPREAAQTAEAALRRAEAAEAENVRLRDEIERLRRGTSTR